MDIAEQYAWRKAITERVFPGESITDFRGEVWTFERVTRPAYGNSTGRVLASRECASAYTTESGSRDCPHMWHPGGQNRQEYFPHVFGLYLGDIEGNEA